MGYWVATRSTTPHSSRSTSHSSSPPESAPGILLRIRPFKENQGVVDGAGLLQSVHDVTTNFRGKNTSDHHSFEVWFDEGKVKFFMHAATEAAADKFRRRVGNNYANSEVFPVDGGAASPLSTPTSTSLVRGWRWRSSRTTRFVTTTATNGRRTLRRNHERDALTRRQHGRHASRLPARKTVLDGRRPVQAQQRRRPRPRTPARNISWMARSPNAASEPEGQSRPPKPSNSSVASKRSTSTSASSQPPRTRTKPKRVPVGSPGCSESTTTP